MICPKCGAELADGVKFCGNCGNPVSQPDAQNTYVPQPETASYQLPPQASQPVAYTQAPREKSKTGLIIAIIVIAVVLIIGGAIAWFVHTVRKTANTYLNGIEDGFETFEDIDIDDIDIDDIDVDIEGLDDAIDSMESPDFSDPFDDDNGAADPAPITDNDTSDAEEYAYGYADVTIAGNDITIIPNGGLNGSTVLYGGKDLDGFLDYVDDTVLEEGRVINREFFYDLLSTMLVDSSMYPEFGDVESNMIMCLAMANNFHNIDVRVKEADLDANNAAEYHYQVKAENRDDTWIVNYADRTVYFNNGSTEYSSDMFKDEYLAYWMMAIEDYYGYSSF